jgi:ABC-2 type transport system ATP-binding protein
VISLDDPLARNPGIVRALVEQGAQVQFVDELRHSLEDVYLSLIHNDSAGQESVQ